MIHGPMAEAQKGFAILEDVDEATFIRFIEWAHKGYYTAAKFVQVESPCASGEDSHEFVSDELVTTPQQTRSFGEEEDAVALPLQETHYAAQPLEDEQLVPDPVEVDSWSSPFQSHHKKGKKGKRTDNWGVSPQLEIDTAQERKRELKEAFISCKYNIRQAVLEVPSPRPNQSSEEDYTDVFLSHARLYVFADMYDVQQLKMLALEELHATLAIYNLYHERTGDIISLLRYVYGVICEREQSNEGMRNLMTQYVGCEMDTLVDDEDFKDLLIEDGGLLLGDFMKMAARIMKGG